MVKGWFSFCKKRHCETCALRKYQAPESLPGFRLIDCDSSSLDVVEQQPTVEYAALSYVWGENIEEAGPWPTVISDAVLVTRQLGLRYLWVDRLCIDQEDAQTKHFLISNMDVVYRSAEITIIAAAGSTADHGLPGVGTAKRKPQPKIQIGATVLASPLENCREDIYRSTWWTRGWTYQEGVLARRRLVFTESQVYWECESMVTWEAIHLPLESLHAKHKFQMDECMNASVFSGKRGGPFQEYRTLSMGEENDESLYKAAMHIHNFTGKNLTLLSPKVQEAYYAKIAERYLAFCTAAGDRDELQRQFARLAITDQRNPKPPQPRAVPLTTVEQADLAAYLILDTACRRGDLAGAYAQRAAHGLRDRHVDAVLRALAADNWAAWRRARRQADLYRATLMEGAERRVRAHALRAIGRAYLTVGVRWVEGQLGMGWDGLREGFGVGWEVEEGGAADGEEEGGKVVVRRVKGK
ncbi:63cffc61-1eea-4624-bb7f-cad39a2ddcf1 [Thermothielavioides terrestris]|uniref:63cffc61-1eea-4624-bb7f-cad39a2ddcf1 n=1 Tax=Thermothielavioides terrestris TaxID=2587410 RepID=A0A446BMU5_9PEZI|nr:63cffc61-1eea-4624-bb7f-cad39a2ddcf1 [Thermothielavioides terrestris]